VPKPPALDVIGSVVSLGRRDAAAPSLRNNRVGGPLADLGDQVGRWVVSERDEPGGIAGGELLASDLGSVKLRGVILVPPKAGVLL
jgi:hypothetical protein